MEPGVAETRPGALPNIPRKSLLHKRLRGDMAAKIVFDLEEAKRFLSIIEPDSDAFTFQTFDDTERKDPKLARVLHGTLEQHAAELKRLSAQGAGAFVTINATDGKGRKAENIAAVRAVFVDLDGAPLGPVERYEHPPHAIIATSPGRYHAYWRTTGMELAQFEGAQRALIEKFDADPSVKDLPRVMRLPGFCHQKGEPFLVHIASTSDVPSYPASTFAASPVLPTTPPPARADDAGSDVAAAERFSRGDPSNRRMPRFTPTFWRESRQTTSDCGFSRRAAPFPMTR